MMLGMKRKVVNLQGCRGVAQEAANACFFKERLIEKLPLLQLRSRRLIPFLAVRLLLGRMGAGNSCDAGQEA